MKKKKNAFTLIELLAIIVILAIIAVITVPIILNIIENSRKGAATDSAYGYKDSVNKTYITELSKPDLGGLKLNGVYEVQSNGTLEPADGYSFGVTNYNTLPVSVSGDKPSSGKLRYANNVLNAGCLVIGDYRVTFVSGSVDQTVKGNCENYEFPTSVGDNQSGNGGSGQNNNNDTMYEYTYYNMFDETKEEGQHKVQTSSPDDKWSMYLRKNLSISSSVIEICSVYENGTICINSDMYDWDSNSWLNTEKTNQLISSFTSFGATCDTSDTSIIECSGSNDIVSWSGDYWVDMLGNDGDTVYCDLYADGDVVCNSLGGIYCSTSTESCYSS